MEYISSNVQCGKCFKYKGTAEGCCECGRPPKFTPELVEKAKEYIQSCKDIEEDKENGIKKKVRLPSIGGLAVTLDVSRSTLYEWAKEHEEFSDIMERMLALQEERLLNNGLSGEYAPTITKVILTKHGYIDKQDVTSDGKAIKGNSIIFSNFKEE